MTEKKIKTVRPRLEALMVQDRDLLKALVKEALDQILQAEMTEFLGAAPGERNGSPSANCGAVVEPSRWARQPSSMKHFSICRVERPCLSPIAHGSWAMPRGRYAG